MRILKRLFLITIVVIIALVLIVYGLNYYPKPIESAAIFARDPNQATTLQPGQTISIMTWNVQFFAGNANNHFFFDHGNDPWPNKATYDRTMQAIANVIRQQNPDVILLQEVDENSKRTFYVDQGKALLALLPKEYHYEVSASDWRSLFFPHPAMFGRVNSKITTISKYKIARATRYKLVGEIERSLLARQFAERRAILDAELPIGHHDILHVLNTHLSAFSKGYPVLQLQIQTVHKRLQSIIAKNEYGLIAGDFNTLPPTPHAHSSLTNEDQKFFEPSDYLSVLFDHYQARPTLTDLMSPDYKKWYTSTPTEAGPKILSKTIDYFFVVPKLKIDDFAILHQYTPLSDHVPLLIKVTIPK